MLTSRENTYLFYSDIEGFTLAMQKKESYALGIKIRHREALEELVAQHGGQIVKHQGDKSLARFNTPVQAVSCAQTLQQTLRAGDQPVPTRIGLHFGELVLSGEEIFGAGIRIAAEVEQLGKAGSVFLTAPFVEALGSGHPFRLQSLGYYLFKGLEVPMEVFGLEASGLVIPDMATHSRAQGKRINLEALQQLSRQTAQQDNIFKTLWKRGVPQLITGYFVAAWGILQFVDWILNRYGLSPYWTDILLVLFLGMVPSVFLVVYNRERIQRGQLSLVEKVAVPANLFLAVGFIFFFFQGTPLGAVTQTVRVEDEFGNEQDRRIINSEFKKMAPIFFFDPEIPDSATAWLGAGIAEALSFDLGQHDYVTSGVFGEAASLNEKTKVAERFNLPDFISGRYRQENEMFHIQMELHKTASGKRIHQHQYSGPDFFALIDSMSQQVKKDIGLSETEIENGKDAPIAELLTDNLEAFRHFTIARRIVANEEKVVRAGHYQSALELDSTFAFAGLILTRWTRNGGGGEEGLKSIVEPAMRHRQRLPEAQELALRANYYGINGEPEKALALLKMQFQLEPENQELAGELFWQYDQMSLTKEMLEHWKTFVDKLPPDQPVWISYFLTIAYLRNGSYEEAVRTMEKVCETYPKLPFPNIFLGLSHYLAGNFAEAEAAYDKAILLNPELEEDGSRLLDAVAYARENRWGANKFKEYEATYRNDLGGEKYWTFSALPNGLYARTRKGMGPGASNWWLPTGPDSFVTWRGTVECTFQKNQRGEIFNRRTNDRSEKRPHDSWRQDDAIWKAETLLKERRYTEALDAFQIAYEQHPEHYYLANYIEHVEYVLSPEYEKDLSQFNKYAGQYGKRKIYEKDGNLYYQHQKSPVRLLPLPGGRFQIAEQYSLQLQMIEQDGKYLIQPIYRHSEDAAGYDW